MSAVSERGELEALVADLARRIEPRGYVQTLKLDGDRGHALRRLTNGRVDVDVVLDMAALVVAVGRHGGTTFVAATWAMVLGVTISDASPGPDDATFFEAHLPAIEERIRDDPEVDQRLRDANWILVKDFLGLDPDLPPPSPGS